MYDFNRLVTKELQEIETTMLELFSHEQVPWVEAIATHVLLKKGKRLRASLIFLLAGALTEKAPATETLTLASVIEMLHAAMLLHDDVIDGAFLRRMQPCAHHIWGPTASILMGDYIYAQSFLLVQTLKNSEISASLARATANIITGELKQQSFLHQPHITLEDYHFIIDNKTAELFATALGNTARLTDPSRYHWAEGWGKDFGRLYQIVDDLLDIASSSDTTDKTLGQDLKQGLVTLPTLLLLEHMNETDRNHLQQAIMNSEHFHEPTYQHWIQQYQIENKMHTQIEEMSRNLIESLEQTLNESPYKNALINLVHYMRKRTH